MEAPLDGIRVVEWSMYATGPMCGVMLRDLGADVIRIEDPGRGGDPTRNMRYVAGITDCQMPGDRNAFFEVMNWGKRSVTFNLKHPQGRELALRLIDKADVFTLNIRPPVVRKLGLDYETLRERNPRLIYATASAYGEAGPQGDRSGNDFTGQARSGIMFGAGSDEHPPLYHLGGFPDMTGATLLAHAVISALYARERSGEGQKVELSNLSAAMWIQYWAVSNQLLLDIPWPRQDRRRAKQPMFNHYLCADGEWIAMATVRDEKWPVFCGLIARPELVDDPRFGTVENRKENATELVAILEEQFATKPRAEWEAILGGDESLEWERVQRLPDLQSDPQVLANEYLVEMEHPVWGTVRAQNYPVKFSESELRPRRAAPDLGEHNFEVLSEELGCSSEEIAELMSAGAFG